MNASKIQGLRNQNSKILNKPIFPTASFKKVSVFFIAVFLVFQPLSSLSLKAKSVILSETKNAVAVENASASDAPQPQQSVLFPPLPAPAPDLSTLQNTPIAGESTGTPTGVVFPAIPAENIIIPPPSATTTLEVIVPTTTASSTLETVATTTPATTTDVTVIKQEEASPNNEPYQHLDVTNQELHSVMPTDLVNPIVLEAKKLNPKLALKLLIQGVSPSATASTATDTIAYFDAFPSTDLEYKLTGKTLKENVILKDKNHPVSFVYQINLAQYDYAQVSTSTIELYRKGRNKNPLFKLYTISAPTMTDANASSSSDIELSLSGDMLTMVPNAEWLKTATYPVNVDPTVEVNVLNVYSHPVEGQYWTIDFVTAGKSDLVITPADVATSNDMQFTTLTCDGAEATSTVSSFGVVTSTNWTCDGLGQVKFYDKKTGHHHMQFSFGSAESNAYNGDNIWVGGASGNWEDGANWSLATVPGPSDDVVIDTDNAVVSINGPTTINSLTIGGTAATSTLSFLYDAIAGLPLTISGDLNVNVFGRVTHSIAGYTGDGVGLVNGRINISVGGNANITGSIDANDKGYIGGNGPGMGRGAINPGGSGTMSSGASHGGLGGSSIAEPAGIVPADTDTYGDMTAPVELGSGGGNPSSYDSDTGWGGYGGGAIKLSVTGTTTINGLITADAKWSSGTHGGGAGGSVYLTTGVLNGNGTISANGAPFLGSSGGGGGGRIAVYYSSDNSTIQYQNHGGAWFCSSPPYGPEDYSRNCPTDGMYGYGLASSTTTSFGGAGTTYKKSLVQTNGDLILDNNNGETGAKNQNLDARKLDLVYEDILGKTPILSNITLDNLTVKNGAYLYLATSTANTLNSTVINLQTLGTIYAAAGTSFTYTTLNWASGMIIYGGGNLALLNQNQDLIIPSSSPESLYPTTLVMKVPGDTRSYSNVSIGGILKSAYNRNVSSSTPESSLYKIDWNITGNLTIDYTGAIDQTNRGFSGNQGFGAGVSTSTNSDEQLRFGTGGTYGGIGGTSPSFPELLPGIVYGSSTAPTDLGSGGGGIGVPGDPGKIFEGGFGGGAVILNVAGTTTLNGLIAADGESFPGWDLGNFDYCRYNRGAGSGGSVYLTTGHLSGYGKISAAGGYVCANYNGGGAGGGGRIAVYSATHDDTIKLNVDGGGFRGGSVETFDRRSPSDPTYFSQGAPGTIYPAEKMPSAVTTNAATGVGDTSATLNGDLTQLGYYDIVDHGFVWAKNAMPYLGIDTNLATGGTATSSGEADSSYSASGAFTGDGSGWSPYAYVYDPTYSWSGDPNGPWYLEYDMPTSAVVNAFYVSAGDGSSSYYGPEHYEIKGWDGFQWVSLQGDNYIERWDNSPGKFYSFNNTTPYSKYRLFIGRRYKDTNGDPGLFIGRLVFYNRRTPFNNLVDGATATAIASSTAMGYDPSNLIYGSGWAYDSNIATGGMATTSSEKISDPAGNAFDNNQYTYWSSEPNLARGGTASSSWADDPSRPVTNAFDGDFSTNWMTDTWNGIDPVDLEYDLGTSKIVNRYDINSPNPPFGDCPPCAGSAPNTWTFDGWNGSSWTALDSRSGESGWGYSGETRSYTFSNSTAYSKYRLHITANNDLSYIALSELSFFNTSAAPTDWLEYDLPQAATATGYSILYDANNYDASSSPNSWNFEAWNGSSWDILHSVTGETDWVSTTTKAYSFANTIAYDKYRINITANNGGIYNSVGELEIFGNNLPQNNLQITLPFPSNVFNYQIVSDPVGAGLSSSSTPKSWDFEGWDATSSLWTLLDSQTGITNWTATSQNFSFFNPTSYTDYRFVFKANNGTGSDPLFINQIKFSEGFPASGQATLNAAVSTGVYSASATGLSPSTTYHYRAYLMDHAGNAYYGPDQSFITTGGGNTPPNPPDTLAPTNLVNGSWVNDTTPTLTFNLTDPDVADTVKYEIQISATSSFSSLLMDYTSPLGAQGAFSFTVGQATGTGSYTTGFAGQTLPDSANYYWRAMTYDNSSATSTYTTANSGAIAFKIDTAPPVPGSLSFSNVAATTITATVSGASDSLSGLTTTPYVLRNITTSVNSGVSSSTSWVDTGLTANTTYSYEVVVMDNAGNTATSSPFSTTTPGAVSPPPSGGGGGSVPPGPLAANYECMVINNDQAETTSRLVALNFSTDATVTKVEVSNNPNFTDSKMFTNFTGNIDNWDLCTGDSCLAGNYTVYAKMYFTSTSTGERVSGVLSDDINYVVVDTTKPPVVNFKTATSTALNTDFSAAVEVELSYATTVPVTISYNLSGGATGSGTVTFPPNTQSANIIVSNIADSTLSKPKTIDVVLSNPINSTLGVPDTHGITIYGSGTIVNIPPVSTSTLAVALETSLDGKTWFSTLKNVPTGTPVSLRVSVSGTAAGEISYQFFCQDDGSISKQVTDNLDKMVVTNLCSYNNSGVYLPLVVVLRDGKSASASTEVTVASELITTDPTFCELHPSSTQCVSYCAQNPTDVNCTCVLNPGDPSCNVVVEKTFCQLNPQDPQCQTGVCKTDPADPACAFCTFYPADPVCASFCNLHPQDPTCQTNYCTLNPTDTKCTQAYCSLHPEDPQCQTGVCKTNPADPACAFCALYPTDPTCRQTDCRVNPNAPACAYCTLKPEDPTCLAYCQNHPTEPACQKTFCAQNPTSPECSGKNPNIASSTTAFASLLKSWGENLASAAATPLNQALTASFAFLAAPLITAAQYAALIPGLGGFQEILLILTQLLQSLLAFLGLRKKRNHWGTVYDSATKQPLDPAIVELIDQKTGKVIEQSITDMTGRYGFLVREGEFKIRSTKTHFLFPSEHVVGSEDKVFDQLYHGENLIINKANSTVIAPNIPMDPLEFDWNQMDKQRLVKFHPLREVLARWFFNSLFYIGLVWTMFTVLVSPSWFNYICLAFYLLILLIQWLIPRERLWGRIYDSRTNLLVPWIILEISSPEFKVVLGRAKSGPDGRFFLKAESGIYNLSVYRKNADGGRELLGSSRINVGKNRVLNADININLS